ncbi:MAG: GIY-YIG nuclease family protein [Alphaproteobacteria bacterium]|jgi:hypothetical protein
MADILLSDIFNFDKEFIKIKDKYISKDKKKRIKLRFNTDWSKVIYKEMYISEDPKVKSTFEADILSIKSDKKMRLSNKDLVFQFIEIEEHKWLFVGAYNIIDVDNYKILEEHAIAKRPWKYAQAKKLSQYDKYAGRIIVNWTNDSRIWFYVSLKKINTVPLYEILSEHYLEYADKFQGYENVCKSYMKLKRCIKDSKWRKALSDVYGVYVITDKNTGKQYVGSAYGENGIFGRWSAYLKKDGYDSNEYPNTKFRTLIKEEGFKYIENNFQYAIIEIFPKSELGKNKALDREKYWKKVLRTFENGYNAN